jgi:F0F1-type ATP synthase assembly protein I
MPKNDMARLGRYYGLVLLLPLSMAVGYAIGYGLDRLFGTHFLRIVFIFVGFASGMIELVRELNKEDAGK